MIKRNRDIVPILAGLLAAAFVVTLALPWPELLAQSALVRLSAEYRRWDFSEDFTSTPAYFGGTTFYEKTVFVPRSANTLYITVSATGDTHEGDVTQLRCEVDGNPCNSGFVPGDDQGWIRLQRHGGFRHLEPCCQYFVSAEDFHDNNVTYSWCATVTPGTRVVTLKMGTENFNDVFLEGIHVFIDANAMPSGVRCTEAPLTADEPSD
jgi:hypothetical protein